MAQYSSDPEQPDPNQQESDDLFGRLTQPEIPVGEAQFSTAHDIRCDKLSQRSARVPELAHELDRINDLKASLMVATRNALVSARSEGLLYLPIEIDCDLNDARVWVDADGKTQYSALVELRDREAQQLVFYNGQVYVMPSGITRAQVMLHEDGSMNYETLFDSQSFYEELMWLSEHAKDRLVDRYASSPILKQVVARTGAMLINYGKTDRAEFTRAENPFKTQPHLFTLETEEHRCQTEVVRRPVDLGIDYRVRFGGSK